MKIFIMGTGHIGSWLVEELCHDHQVAIYDTDPRKMKYFFNIFLSFNNNFIELFYCMNILKLLIISGLLIVNL